MSSASKHAIPKTLQQNTLGPKHLAKKPLLCKQASMQRQVSPGVMLNIQINCLTAQIGFV